MFWNVIWKTYRAFCRWIIKRTATHIFYVSRNSLMDIVNPSSNSLGGSIEQKWIPPAIDIRTSCRSAKHLEPVRCRQSIYRVACIGRMHESRFIGNPKNQQMIISIASQFRKQNLKPSAIKFFLVGDGAARPKFEQEVADLGLCEFIEFTGEISNVPEFLWEDIDLVLAPSTHEGFGMTVVEAQLQGVPVVISENIPDETILSNRLVARQSLESGIDGWANAVHTQWRRIQNNELDSKLTERQRVLTLIQGTVYTPEHNAIAMLDSYRDSSACRVAGICETKGRLMVGGEKGEIKWD
ncbi:MAG: glycosyltransferase [Planctomycetaceae bacterium]|nr:glycosyltransferase [Planctomycetaceae bacterium]